MDDHATELSCYTNGTDTVVARDAEDARAVAAETMGEDVEDIVEPMRRVDDGEVLDVFDEDRGERVAKTAREWVQFLGRGLLCTTEPREGEE